jgi:hypothetical protein
MTSNAISSIQDSESSAAIIAITTERFPGLAVEDTSVKAIVKDSDYLDTITLWSSIIIV